MDDLISRQAAIDALNKLARKKFTLAYEYEIYLGALHEAADDIRGLPSAQQEQVAGKLDLISRQAAIDALGERPMVWMDSDYEIAQRNQYDRDKLAIETVPSAQLETCEGCKHLGKWENEFEYGYPSPCTRCKRRVEDHYER